MDNFNYVAGIVPVLTTHISEVIIPGVCISHVVVLSLYGHGPTFEECLSL